MDFIELAVNPVPVFWNGAVTDRILVLQNLRNNRKRAAGGAINGIADHADEWVGGTGVHISIGAAVTLADKTAFGIPP